MERRWLVDETAMVLRRAKRPEVERDAAHHRFPNAEDLAKSKEKMSEYAYLADEIEKDILRGKMFITDDGDIQYSFGKKKIYREQE